MAALPGSLEELCSLLLGTVGLQGAGAGGGETNRSHILDAVMFHPGKWGQRRSEGGAGSPLQLILCLRHLTSIPCR